MSRIQELLSGGIQPGLYRTTSRMSRERLCREAQQAGWHCIAIDGRAIHDKPSFLAAFAAALNFPAYFGHNWDAFEESLNDLALVQQQGTLGLVVLLEGADRFARANPRDWEIARDILTDAAARWQQASMPLVILLRGARIAGRGLEKL